MSASGLGLFSWLWHNSGRVLKLLRGLLDRLPHIGEVMEGAGNTMITVGTAINGGGGQPGAAAAVNQVHALLVQQKAASTAAIHHLRDTSALLREVTVQWVTKGEREETVRFNPYVISFSVPTIDLAPQTPLGSVATELDHQITGLEALTLPLDHAIQSLARLSGILAAVGADMNDAGTLLRDGGRELKAVSAP
ncbi:MAG TPA: hypothetical protein VM890_02030 [Longimicrobium sp.]|jgi:hypothetical protein|nr:hypothetical protein [Longimicrobium sp.]